MMPDFMPNIMQHMPNSVPQMMPNSMPQTPNQPYVMVVVAPVPMQQWFFGRLVRLLLSRSRVVDVTY